jgi:signal transduction histidine kinase
LALIPPGHDAGAGDRGYAETSLIQFLISFQEKLADQAIAAHLSDLSFLMISPTDKLKSVDFAPIGIWKLDRSLKVAEANQAVGKLLGMPNSALAGRSIFELLPALPKDDFLLALDADESICGKQVQLDECGTKKECVLLELWLRQLKNEDGTPEGLILTTVEITQREALRKEREDFFANLAHNLKSPLVGADMILSSLMHEEMGSLTAAQRNSLALIKSSNLDLLAMVQELMEVLRFETESDSLAIESMDFAALIDQCLLALTPSAQANRVSLSVSIQTGLTLAGDRKAISRLFSNLIDCAIRRTVGGGIVSVWATAKSGYLLAEISDTGHGVESQSFLQAESNQDLPNSQSEANNYCGKVWGLGLYLCHQIIIAHGGQMKMNSKPHGGTLYSITLPLTQSASVATTTLG